MRSSKFDRKQVSGFTLAEIMTTVIIVGLIASFALPQYGVILEKTKAQEGNQTLLAILAAQKRFAVESGGTYTNSLTNLDVTFPASAYFGAPTVSNNAGALATVTRNAANNYILSIADTGVITCSGGTTGYCSKMGY